MKVYTVLRWKNKWSKVKTLQDTPRSRWPGFFNKLCEKCYRKSCKYMHNNSTRLQGKFRAQRYGDMWPTKVGKPWREKRRCTLHAGIRRICKLYTKGRSAGKLTWCEPSSNHLDYRWWDNIQRSSPQNTGLAKTATTLHLGNCEFRHAMGARIFYTSPLRKFQKS